MLTTRDGGACLVVQRDLIATFLDDFSRHGREAPLLRKTLYAAAEQLGGKFVMSRVEEGVRAQQVRKGVDLLCLARVLSRVRHSSGNGLPLGAEGNERFFKLLLLDVGLVSGLLGLTGLSSAQRDAFVFRNRGAIAEQFVGQQVRSALAAAGDTALHYWQRAGGRQGELDYLVQAGAHVLPVEVKSGRGGAMKSLHRFMYEKQLTAALRFDTNNFSSTLLDLKTTEGHEMKYRLYSAPIYMAERLFTLAGQMDFSSVLRPPKYGSQAHPDV